MDYWSAGGATNNRRRTCVQLNLKMTLGGILSRFAFPTP